MAIAAQNPASNPDDPSDTVLQLPDNRLLIDLCGELDRNIVQIESRLGVEVRRRGNHLALHGTAYEREAAEQVLRSLYARLENGPSEPRFSICGLAGLPQTVLAGTLECCAIPTFSLRSRQCASWRRLTNRWSGPTS